MAGVLAGCGWFDDDTKPSEFNIGYVIGRGEGDSQSIKKIVMPGQTVKREKDDETELVYGNARNFNIQEGNGNADTQTPLVANSKPSDDGNTPGVPIKANGIMAFALNRPANTKSCDPDSKADGCRALMAFYQFCQKYGCTLATNDEGSDTDNPEQQNLSSDQGWMKMLYEGPEQAIRHAYSDVIATYGTDIENNRAEWPKIAAKMMKLFTAEMDTAIGLPKGVSIFCSPTVISGETCVDPTFTFHDITVVRTQAQIDALNKERDLALTEQSKSAQIASDTRLENEQQALDVLKAQNDAALLAVPGQRDKIESERRIAEIQACAAAGPGKCVIVVGGNASTQLQVPAG